MSYELLHFRGSEEILKNKNLDRDVAVTMEYLNDAIYGTAHRREILRMVMDETAWRNGDDLNIIPGRRYTYKGLKKRVAIDGTFSSYEFIQTALFRLQLGYDMKKLDMGIVLVTAQRSEKSPLGSTRQLILQELELLHPTISLPVTIALFDLGKPGEIVEEAVKQTNESSQTQGSALPVHIETTKDNIDGDHHESIEEHDSIPVMPSTRRHYNPRRARIVVNQ